MKQETLKMPGNRYRPLRILHDFLFQDAAAFTFADKKRVIDARLDDLQKKGYGGIVTNVDFQEYLQNEENWELFEYSVKQAIYRKMRVWIYDEKGYPSGAAGGLTLRDHPEYEAKALACICRHVKSGEEVVIEKPKGHLSVAAAYALVLRAGDGALQAANPLYASKPEDAAVDHTTGAPIDLDLFTDEAGTLRWTASCDCTVFYLAVRTIYEGSHAQHNVFASRRYISVLNPDAVAAFLKNTYTLYQERVGDYFGNEIEAFFTDEPSIMAAYLNAGIVPQRIEDPADAEIPLYSIVAWEDNILNEFAERYGYDLRLSLHYLFAGTTDKALRIRYHFYKMLSDLFEEAFFKQIGDFCNRTGIAFSGHVLLEENLLHHPIFEGNLFRFMRHMDIPGIDMLTTLPQKILNCAVTPKLVASSANWHGKRHVMSEISGHAEVSERHHFTVREMTCAAALQFALGVDTFASYYDDSYISPEDNKRFCDTLARIGELFHGSSSLARIALYYPIDSAYIVTKGSAKQLEDREFGAGALACEESWRRLTDVLLRGQFQFDCLDLEALRSMELSGEKPCAVNRVTGQAYDILVIPRLLTLTQQMVLTLTAFADHGVRILFDALSTNIFMPDIDYASDLIDTVRGLLSRENVINCAAADEIPKFIRNLTIPEVEIIGPKETLICTGRRGTAAGLQAAFLFVNCGSTPAAVQVRLDTGLLRHPCGAHRLSAGGALSCGACGGETVDSGAPVQELLLTDPWAGAYMKIPARYLSDGRIQIPIEIEAFGCRIIGLKQA